MGTPRPARLEPAVWTAHLRPGVPYLVDDQPVHQCGLTYWLLLWALWGQGQAAIGGTRGMWTQYRWN